MKQEYNIIFKSTAGEGTNIYSKKYFFDWNLLPEGMYKVNYNFICLNFASIEQNGLIYMNLGNNTTYEVNSNKSSVTSDLLGHLYLYAPTTTYRCWNKEFGSSNDGFFINRPNNNYITINTVFQDKTPLLLIKNYILILNLQLVNNL